MAISPWTTKGRSTWPPEYRSAAGLRFHGLAAQPFWCDEFFFLAVRTYRAKLFSNARTRPRMKSGAPLHYALL